MYKFRDILMFLTTLFVLKYVVFSDWLLVLNGFFIWPSGI